MLLFYDIMTQNSSSVIVAVPFYVQPQQLKEMHMIASTTGEYKHFCITSILGVYSSRKKKRAGVVKAEVNFILEFVCFFVCLLLLLLLLLFILFIFLFYEKSTIGIWLKIVR